MIPALIAVFGSMTAYFGWQASKHSKATNINISTNHGKRPGEYLEMVGQVAEQIREQTERLKEHAEVDAENFLALAKIIVDNGTQ